MGFGKWGKRGIARTYRNTLCLIYIGSRRPGSITRLVIVVHTEMAFRPPPVMGQDLMIYRGWNDSGRPITGAAGVAPVALPGKRDLSAYGILDSP